MKDRILNNIITTLVGVGIIAASIASVFVLKMGWTEASVGMAVGIGLVVAKDPKKSS